MVSFTQAFMVAAIAFAATVSATPAHGCAHKVELDFSGCADKNPDNYNPTFVSKDFYLTGGKHVKFSADAKDGVICIPKNVIKGHVFLGYQSANVEGTNVESVHAKFDRGFGMAKLHTHDKSGRPVIKQSECLCVPNLFFFTFLVRFAQRNISISLFFSLFSLAEQVAEFELTGADGHTIVSTGREGKITADGQGLGLKSELLTKEPNHELLLTFFYSNLYSSILPASSPKVRK